MDSAVAERRLAEFYQNTDIDDKEVHLVQPSAYDIQYLRQNRLVPLTTLLTVDHSSPYYHDEQKGSVFYAESWALTHYLEINDFEHKTQSIQTTPATWSREKTQSPRRSTRLAI